MADDKEFPPPKPPAPTAAALPSVSAGKSNLQPPRQYPYRQPFSRNQQHRRRRWKPPSGRRICCCCCFWSLLVLLVAALIISVAAVALYVLYHPSPPSFAVPSLRIHRLNLTTSSDSSVSHLSSLFNLTLITQNPNSHFTFDYNPFSVTIVTDPGEYLLGNGTIPAFSSGEKNQTSFRAIVVTSTEARELDVTEVSGIRSVLKRKGGSGLDLKVVMDTKVEISMGKLKTRKVGIRVSCDGFKGSVPRGKGPSMASTDKSKCKVDLRIKIWNWTF
ncbi:PREDICTED: uncharacterized protein LOC104804513 [Tarenaya hassleriana]|uniref:uncharacterized protein LOC104804513 n=1 Tax=Tarenaya hassleriana TaxID=28532 RepID=UPI00053C1D9E|nr:PREDICTED: uncharacterized protein LOC104804513 [Tarenaya hassleriana]